MRPPVGVSANIFRTLVAVNSKGLVLDKCYQRSLWQ